MSQKMKRIEIKVNGSLTLSKKGCLYQAELFGDDAKLIIEPFNGWQTLIFEVPAIEPKREITPSEFDKLWLECKEDSYPMGMIAVDALKKKLFPDWEG